MGTTEDPLDEYFQFSELRKGIVNLVHPKRGFFCVQDLESQQCYVSTDSSLTRKFVKQGIDGIETHIHLTFSIMTSVGIGTNPVIVGISPIGLVAQYGEGCDLCYPPAVVPVVTNENNGATHIELGPDGDSVDVNAACLAPAAVDPVADTIIDDRRGLGGVEQPAEGEAIEDHLQQEQITEEEAEQRRRDEARADMKIRKIEESMTRTDAGDAFVAADCFSDDGWGDKPTPRHNTHVGDTAALSHCQQELPVVDEFLPAPSRPENYHEHKRVEKAKLEQYLAEEEERAEWAARKEREEWEKRRKEEEYAAAQAVEQERRRLAAEEQQRINAKIRQTYEEQRQQDLEERTKREEELRLSRVASRRDVMEAVRVHQKVIAEKKVETDERDRNLAAEQLRQQQAIAQFEAEQQEKIREELREQNRFRNEELRKYIMGGEDMSVSANGGSQCVEEQRPARYVLRSIPNPDHHSGAPPPSPPAEEDAWGGDGGAEDDALSFKSAWVVADDAAKAQQEERDRQKQQFYYDIDVWPVERMAHFAAYPFLYNKLDYPIFVEGFLDIYARQVTNAKLFDVFSRRFGRFQMVESADQLKGKIYMTAMLFGPGTNDFKEIQLHARLPACIRSIKTVKTLHYECKGYGLIGIAHNEHNESSWVCWNDITGLMPMQSGCARILKKKYANFQPSMKMVMFDATSVNHGASWSVKTIHYQDLTNLIEEAAIPRQAYFVQDLVFRRNHTAKILVFYSPTIDDEVMVPADRIALGTYSHSNLDAMEFSAVVVAEWGRAATDEVDLVEEGAERVAEKMRRLPVRERMWRALALAPDAVFEKNENWFILSVNLNKFNKQTKTVTEELPEKWRREMSLRKQREAVKEAQRAGRSATPTMAMEGQPQQANTTLPLSPQPLPLPQRPHYPWQDEEGW